MTEILISVTDPRWRSLDGLDACVRSAAGAALTAAELPADLAAVSEIGVELSDDGAIRVLNRQFRNRDRATNVLSFPGYPSLAAALEAAGENGRPSPLPILLGDIILAYETVAREAQEQNKPLAHHLTHLIVHGVLHLLGYDHEESRAAARMEDLERRILADLGIPDPYVLSDTTLLNSDCLENDR